MKSAHANPQHGFAIISAIFILVVLSILGAFVLNISSMQQVSSAQDVQGSRAYQAARAGLEWGMYQVNITNAGPLGATRAAGTACPADTDLFPIAAFPGFTVSVVCKQSTPAAFNGAPAVYRITATACNQPYAGAPGTACPNINNPNNLYIERQLEVTL